MSTDYDTDQLQRLEPAYLEHFGLTEPPFAASLDDRFFYPTADLSQQVNMLVHMTQYSDMVLLVTGIEGMGKTALLQYFLKAAHENWHICRINANSMMDYDQMMFRIAEGFGLESLPGDSAELQELLLEKLDRMHQNDILPVVILDDADELARDATELLYNLAELRANDGPMMHIVMFALPQFDQTLQSSSVQPLVERLTHMVELKPLTESETIEYINNRLTVAGAGDEPLFSDKVLKKIYKLSEGVPSRINELAHMALNEFEPTETPPAPEPEKTEEDVVYHPTDDENDAQEKRRFPLLTILYVILALLIGFILLNQDKINRLFETGDMDELFSSKPDVEKYMPKKDQPDTEDNPFATGEGGEKIISLSPDADQTPPVIEQIKPGSFIADGKDMTLTVQGQHFTANASVTIGWTGNSKPLPPGQFTVESDTSIKIKFNPGKQVDQWSITVSDAATGISNSAAFTTTAPPKPVQQQTTSKTTPPKQKDKQKQQKGRKLTALEWVMAQPPKNITLQLSGSHSLKTLKAFVKQYSLEEEGKIIKTHRQGKDWYILLFGSYPGKQAAQDAINAMPESVRRDKPWQRSFASIQKLFKNKGKQTQKPPKKITPTAIAPPIATHLKEHAAWLWSQDPGHYTLQLLGTHNSEKLVEFVRQHKLQGKVVYYQTRRDGKQWFALVYGDYPDSRAARVAAGSLPDAIKQLHPWVRKFSAVHIEMDKAKKP